VDLALLSERLTDLGEPAYRTGQVWKWAAGGVASYDEMTNVPARLRAELTGGVVQIGWHGRGCVVTV